jgi:hypothetical protein
VREQSTAVAARPHLQTQRLDDQLLRARCVDALADGERVARAARKQHREVAADGAVV